MAVLPQWRVERRTASASICVLGRAEFGGDGSAYGLHVLREEIARLGRVAKGRRTHELNRTAFAVARVVAAGELVENPARSAVWSEALRIGLGEHEVRLTIESPFRAGRERPRCAPNRLC
jgi:putative DNA primase/helicase